MCHSVFMGQYGMTFIIFGVGDRDPREGFAQAPWNEKS